MQLKVKPIFSNNWIEGLFSLLQIAATVSLGWVENRWYKYPVDASKAYPWRWYKGKSAKPKSGWSIWSLFMKDNIPIGIEVSNFSITKYWRESFSKISEIYFSDWTVVLTSRSPILSNHPLELSNSRINWLSVGVSGRIFNRLVLIVTFISKIQKPLHYKSITVLSFYLLPLLLKVATQFLLLTIHSPC